MKYIILTVQFSCNATYRNLQEMFVNAMLSGKIFSLAGLGYCILRYPMFLNDLTLLHYNYIKINM